MIENDGVVIAGMSRTPIGGLLGDLSELSASELGGIAVKSALSEANLGSDDAEQIIMGNCLGAGQGQAPARQAGFNAGLNEHAQATTINKMCGSGLQAINLANNAVVSGEADIVIAGGMESMTNAPHLINLRKGHKYGTAQAQDHMALDGLSDAYTGEAMGVYADKIAVEYQFTREQQDAYALETLKRAQTATSNGKFNREIAPVTIKTRKGETTIETDELPRIARPEKIPTLRPAFNKDGTVTAANASAISDGAAAVVVMSSRSAEKNGTKPIARIVATASHAHAPEYFTTAPVSAINKALSRAGWTVKDVDLWEVNEAFAVVPMIAMKELGISHEILNVNGGACAMGHPIGASGARVLITLLAAMEDRDVKRGVASLCIGGGEGIAMAVERF